MLTFRDHPIIETTAQDPASIVAADLDADGDDDLLYASLGDHTVAWFENRLNETPGDLGVRHVIAQDVLGAAGAYAADMDLDGDLDVIIGAKIDSHVAWYENRLNEESADFGQKRVIALVPTFLAMTVADLDGDGDSDVVSSSGSTDVQWFENRLDEAEGDFAPGRAIDTDSNRVLDLTAFDLDGDGDDDLLAGAGVLAGLFWYENRLDRPAGDFEKHRIVLGVIDFHGGTVADVDGDGDGDIVAARGLHDVLWYENRLDQADSAFGPERVISTDVFAPMDVFAEDLDGDGDLDVLSASSRDDTVAWFENRLDEAAADFGPRQVISSQAKHAVGVLASDLDGDGDPDVATISRSDDQVTWHENRLRDEGGFGPEQALTTGINHVEDVAFADLDGDGDADLLSASDLDDTIAWYENRFGQAREPFGEQRVITTRADGAASVVPVDIDGDGDLDVLSSSYREDVVDWYENRLNQQEADFGPRRVISDTLQGPRTVFAADLDGDGDQDVLVAGFGEDTVAWFENRTNEPEGGFSSRRDLTTTLASCRDVAAADLDGDGDPDVVASSSFDGSLVWFENRLNAEQRDFAESRFVAQDALAVRRIRLTDLDDDDDADVLVAAFSPTDPVYWFENRLLESEADFSPRFSIAAAESRAEDVIAADLDGDGDQDIVVAASAPHAVTWYENRRNEGENDFSVNRPVSTNLSDATTVAATDIDGDGDIDVVSGSQFDQVILWHENDPDVTAPVATFAPIVPDPRNTPAGEIPLRFSEPVLGLDVGDLTLRIEGADAPSDSLLLSGAGASYTIRLDGIPTVEGVHELVLRAAGSDIQDAIGNRLIEDASVSWRFDSRPPSVSVTINDLPTVPSDLPAVMTWEVLRRQRSEIRALTLSFSEAVAMEASDLVLRRHFPEGNGQSDLVVPLIDEHLKQDGTTWIVRLDAVELNEGEYTLEVLASVSDSAGNSLDGDADGTAGDPHLFVGGENEPFYVLRSDWTGDRAVSIFDFPSLWLGDLSGLPSRYLDQFVENFGRAAAWPLDVHDGTSRPDAALWSAPPPADSGSHSPQADDQQSPHVPFDPPTVPTWRIVRPTRREFLGELVGVE